MNSPIVTQNKKDKSHQEWWHRCSTCIHLYRLKTTMRYCAAHIDSSRERGPIIRDLDAWCPKYKPDPRWEELELEYAKENNSHDGG